MNEGVKKQYLALRQAFEDYAKEYGGARALAGSPYFHVAVVVTLLSWPLWVSGGAPALAIAVVPGLLGFSIAAFTLSLGIGSDRFRILLAAKIGSSESVVASMANAFLHFILVQVAAILCALIASGDPVAIALSALGNTWDEVPDGVQFVLLALRALVGLIVLLLVVYAVVLLVPAMLHIYRASRTFRKFAQREFDRESKAPVERKVGNREARAKARRLG